MKRPLSIPALFFIIFFVLPCVVQADEIPAETVTTMKAEVVEILLSETKQVPGTDMHGDYQTITAKILEGNEEGKIVTIKNDYLTLAQGEKFYAQHTINSLDSVDRYDAIEPYRLRSLGLLLLLFLLVLFSFGGKQGFRGLLSLCASFAFIAFALLPGIMQGYSPVLVSMIVSGVIIVCGSYITHGVNKTTSSAVVGMLLTMLITGIIATSAITFTRLSGTSGHETFYLQMNTQGHLDLSGLLLGGMLIGLLGVLYDAAIGQAVAIEELLAVAGQQSRRYVFERALRIGREHIGALVNILAIAYTGTALPLLLLYYSSGSGSLLMTINGEIFATEIVRILIGSIGLILAVPITTVVAMFMLHPRRA